MMLSANFIACIIPTDPTPVINADHIAFMQSGISINVAACDRHNMPSQVRAFGCRISPDGLRATVFVPASRAAAVLADIRGNGAIAVVFSKPSTNYTIQIKGHDADISNPTDADLLLVQTYRAAFARELEPLGHTLEFTHALLNCPPSDIVALSFTPTEAFSQTPGPKAGESLSTQA